MTSKYNDSDQTHRTVRDRIERGNGLCTLVKVDEVRSALQQAGSKVEHEENFDKRSTPHPWYYPIVGQFWKAQTWADFKIAVLMNSMTIFFVTIQLWLFILLGLRDREQMAGYEILQSCVKGVADGSEMGIFTPMWFLFRRMRRRRLEHRGLTWRQVLGKGRGSLGWKSHEESSMVCL